MLIIPVGVIIGQDASLGSLIAYPAQEDCYYFPEQMCQLSVVNPQTRTQNFIVDVPGLEPSSMRWSPDGRKLVFLYRPGDNFDIGMINADGTDFQRLTETDEDEGFLAWSPDGAQLAFSSGAEFDWELFTTSVTDWNPTQRTERVRVLGSVQWSPDGKDIWFTGVDASAVEHIPNQIYAVNVASGQLANITNSATAHEEIQALSSNGKSLLLQSIKTDTDLIPRPASLQIMDMASGNRHIIVDAVQGLGKAAWALDDTNIVYQLTLPSAEDNLQRNLYMLNLEDNQIIQLPSSLPNVLDFDISPDGAKIVYIGEKETTANLCIMSLNDFAEFCLDVEPATSGSPAWG